jgi:hypothetical protein
VGIVDEAGHMVVVLLWELEGVSEVIGVNVFNDKPEITVNGLLHVKKQGYY